MGVSADKTKVSEEDATVTLKFILEEPFIIATDALKVMVPPVNKDYEEFAAAASLTPVHKPEHDSPPDTTIASKLKFTDVTGATHENAVTNDLAGFDYNTWDSRVFWFYIEGYSPGATT